MSPEVKAFEATVRRFCAWAESDRHDLTTAHETLLALMHGIHQLVAANIQNDEEPGYSYRSNEQWKADHKRFSDFPFQYYRQIFAPCQLDEEPPVIGDVCDDFADIYGDLWHGLQALNHNDWTYAAHHWRESYFNHWGHHAAGALYAIDEYYRQNQNGGGGHH